MRDSTIFYRSFYDSIKLLPKRYQLAFYDALFDYMFDDVEPSKLMGGAAALFKALKPQIDVNNQRYENGKKGGRPRKNQTETKPKPNDNQTYNQTETKAEPNVNVNVNVNDNGNGSGCEPDDFSPGELYFFKDIP